MKIVVLEIGRPIAQDVAKQIGEPTKVISYPRLVLEEEYPKIRKEVYDAVREAGAGGEEVVLVLSGPLGLAFTIGQLVGLSHWKLTVYQFTAGSYRPVPPPTRDEMF
jgi:hypothetical protein